MSVHARNAPTDRNAHTVLVLQSDTAATAIVTDPLLLAGTASPAPREPAPAVYTHVEGAPQGRRRAPAATASRKSVTVQSLHLPDSGTSRLRHRSVKGCDVFGRRLPGAPGAAAAAAAPSSSTGSDACQSPEPAGSRGLAGHRRRQSGSPCAVQGAEPGERPGQAVSRLLRQRP